MQVEKKYGVIQQYDGKYALVTDIITKVDRFGKEHTYQSINNNLAYKRLDYAIKQADIFMKNVYKPFVNFQNEQVDFIYTNLGLIK